MTIPHNNGQHKTAAPTVKTSADDEEFFFLLHAVST